MIGSKDALISPTAAKVLAAAGLVLLTGAIGLVIGNEGSGVTRQLQDMADIRVRIEMDGFESLNVAVAGGIMMYELSTSEIQKGMSE